MEYLTAAMALAACGMSFKAMRRKPVIVAPPEPPAEHLVQIGDRIIRVRNR